MILFWAGKDKINGGQCLVAWNTICRPYCHGGLEVKNLKLQALTLRVRWEWLRRTDDERPWQGLKIVPDKESREVFDSLVSISVGDGKKILFWHDRWINGRAVADIAPSILAIVPTRTQNMCTVYQALGSRRWERDVPEELNFTVHMQLYLLQHAISLVDREEGRPDIFTWSSDRSGAYSANSTYKSLCLGLTYSQSAPLIWKTWAPLKCKIFIWLAS